MKVLLFCQTGDARPKCVGRSCGPLGYWARRPVGKDLREDPAAMVFVPGVGNYGGTNHMRVEKHRADRWWLVECKNAEHGREVIACTEQTCEHQHYGQCVDDEGRILASGGKP